ncbi:MAG: transposase [Lachnospiraceae bacterium]|nr:transposase [Lachnospiraceae bacterium]
MQRTPTIKHRLPDPEEYVKDPEYYKTGETVKRQKIILNVSVEVVEYEASVFRHRGTGSRVHADFPEGYDADISYDASVKAFAFLLANEGNVSAGKIKTILREITKGKIDISEATINGLCREFSMKSEEEQNKNCNELMSSPVLNTDFTTSNVNGETKQVLIVASPLTNALMMIGRDSKGHNGIIGTPIEAYVGTLVHDHDRTFYSYAIRHQECMQHNIRYLIGSIENEPNLEWNKEMHKLIKEMLHYRNSLADEENLDPKVVARFEKKYDKILDLAKDEYEYEPPSEYYKEGYNLYLRLVRYKESELLFLHDKSVPANNSLAERLARVFKRKQKQAIVLRSNENFRALCNSISLIQTFRYKDEENLFQRVAEIFARPKPTLISTQSV